MRSLLLSLLVAMMTLLWAPGSVWASSSVKSYREWKQEKIQQAQIRLNQRKQALQLQLRQKGETESSSLGRRLKTQVKNDEVALEAARDLTVSDYFAGYLIHQGHKNAYKEVASRLSTEEVAELMAAYANSVFSTKPGALPPSAQNMRPELGK